MGPHGDNRFAIELGSELRNHVCRPGAHANCSDNQLVRQVSQDIRGLNHDCLLDIEIRGGMEDLEFSLGLQGEQGAPGEGGAREWRAIRGNDHTLIGGLGWSRHGPFLS
jgi:hypothetical protein